MQSIHSLMMIWCVSIILIIAANAYQIIPRNFRIKSYQCDTSRITKLNYISNHNIIPSSIRRLSTTRTFLFKKKDKEMADSQSSGIIIDIEAKDAIVEGDNEIKKEPSAFEQVASKGLAGVLAIACAEAIFWALGVPFAQLYYKYTTGEWIDLTTTEGQLQAAGFSFGYGGFATVILQYRVTLFAIPLVPLMENLVVTPGKKIFGETFGQNKE